jgi:hypothetical protein
MNYLVLAIKNLRPNSEFVITDKDYSTIEWLVLEGTAPTKKQVDDEVKRIKAAAEADATSKAEAKAALLDRLGITAEEASLLLG